MKPPGRTRASMLISVGTVVVVLAVLMFGLTTDSGAVDWVSVITAAAGFVMVGTGLFVAYRDAGNRTTT